VRLGEARVRLPGLAQALVFTLVPQGDSVRENWSSPDSLHLLFHSSHFYEDISSSQLPLDCVQQPLGRHVRSPMIRASTWAPRASNVLFIIVNTSFLSSSGLGPSCEIQSSKLSLEWLLVRLALLVYPPRPLSGASCHGLRYRISLSCSHSIPSCLSVTVAQKTVPMF